MNEAISHWKKNNKEKHNANNRASYAKNKGKYTEKKAAYYQKNREHLDELRRIRKGQEKKHFSSTPEEQDQRKNEKRKLRYQANPTPHIERVHKRRRNLGFNKLNESFSGSVWHHINNDDVVAIPKTIHEKFSNNLTQKHRELIMKYFGSLENMLMNRTP